MARRVFPIALFLLALAPRLIAINRYVTPDELVWVYRSLLFREALADGRWGDTLVAGHPGVTTTWLGALAMSTQLAVEPEARDSYQWLTKIAYLLPDNVEAFQRLSEFLSSGRVAVAVVNSLAIVLLFLLVRQLWGFEVAALASLLLALDPFAAGLGGLFHVDALSASFALVSLLTLGVASTSDDRGDRWRPIAMLVLSGGAAALAVLTKTPTVVLLGVAAIIFGLRFVLLRGPLLSAARRRLIRDALIWGAALALTALIALPALWAAPGNVVDVLSGNANRHLDEALRPTYFLGNVAFDHGPLFYPVVLLWRNGPVVLLALLPLVALLFKSRQTDDVRGRGVARLNAYIPMLLLLLWAMLFLGLITVAAKKFDRYALPIIPALMIGAALAWIIWSRRWGRAGMWLPWALVAVQAVYLLLFIAYPLAAYNPLIGGPYTAVRVLPIGWGEGISAAGRWLTESQPTSEDENAMAGVAPSLAPFFDGRTLVEGYQPSYSADYLIHTLGGRQLDAQALEQQVAGLELLETVRFGGLEQAWVYHNPLAEPVPEPEPLATPVRFGERMALLAAETTYADDQIRIAAEWQRLAELAPNERYLVRIVIQDPQGNVWASVETDLLNSVYFFPPDWEADESGTVRYLLELTPAIPPSTYSVDVTVVAAASGNQLAAQTADGDFLGVVYPIDEVTVPVSDAVVSAARVQIPRTMVQTWLEGALQLLGTSELPDEALAGSDLPIDLFWHSPDGNLPDGLHLQWLLRSLADDADWPAGLMPLSRFDTGEWRTGETIHEKYRLALPPQLPPGAYTVAVSLMDDAGNAIGSPATIGELGINNIDRNYDLPTEVSLQLDTCFDDLICLRGISPAEMEASAGTTVDLELVWQTVNIPDRVYTVFFHVVDRAGNIVLQADHWPGGLPTDILDSDQVIVDSVSLALPSDLPPGQYDLRLGLYSADDGRRLPVTGGPGQGEDRLLLRDYLTVSAP